MFPNAFPSTRLRPNIDGTMAQSAGMETPLTVLVVDDEELLIRSCSRILEQEGFTTLTAARGGDALEMVRRHEPDIMLTDLKLPDVSGMDLLRDAREIDPELLVIMVTGFATVDSSIEAIKAGAYDYIPKPFTATQLQVLIGRAANQIRLARDNERLRGQLRERYAFDNIIGGSDAMQRVLTLVERVATTDASVLISGESGTGKELIARAIHTQGRRSDGPFVAVNCAAFPETLLESELFGHEKGAFTGADMQKRGLMEHAAGGTFLLDEVCEMSQELQAKMLRALQEHRIRRVGGKEEIALDIRVVAATNRDPETAVEEGVLREDLYFRLNVIPIRVPPLRARREDILPLVRHYLAQFSERYDRAGLRLTPEAITALETYEWPGNVRELQNLTERIVSLARPGQQITVRDLPSKISGHGAAHDAGRVFRTDRPFHEAKDGAIDAFERAYLRSALAEHDGNISQAARAAQVSRKTIHRLLQKHDLDAADRAGGGGSPGG